MCCFDKIRNWIIKNIKTIFHKKYKKSLNKNDEVIPIDNLIFNQCDNFYENCTNLTNIILFNYLNNSNYHLRPLHIFENQFNIKLTKEETDNLINNIIIYIDIIKNKYVDDFNKLEMKEDWLNEQK